MSTLDSELIEEEPRPTSTFPVESGAVLHRLRVSISDLLKTMPRKVHSTRDLQKMLGVNVKLCWQVLKLTTPGDALSLAQYVPNPGPMSKFLNAATTFGVDSEIVSQIRSAYGAFEEQVAIHAGDRTTFESMATGTVSDAEGSDDDLQRAALKLRKSGFQLYSQYMGAQLGVHMTVSIEHPGSVPGRLDGASLRTKLGIRRLRADSNLIVDRFMMSPGEDVDNDRDTFQKKSFDPESGERWGAPVIARFCSNPLPQFKTVKERNGGAFTSIIGDNIGNKGSADLVFGQIVPNSAMHISTDGKRIGFGTVVGIATPTAVMIIDQLVHRPTFPEVDYNFSVEWQRVQYGPPPEDSVPSLPFRERIMKMDGGVKGAATREVPRYVEMVEFMCNRLNWNVNDFDVYRVRVEYPLMYTKLWAKFEAKPVDFEIQPHILG
jgi:hypothetical protein